MRGMLRAALVALALPSARLPAQDAAPAANAKAPAAFTVDRAAGPLAFDVAFSLADHDEAHLQIRFDELDPEGPGEPKGDGEHEILALDFQPFEGARFVLSRSTRTQSLVSSALMQVPEPAGLEFKLHVELPQEGGLAATLPDGMPVVVATTPRARRIQVEFAASGGVVAFTATKAERSTRLGLPDFMEAGLVDVMRRFLPPPASGDPQHALGRAMVEGLPPAPAVKEVRAVDRQEVGDGILERFVVAFEEGIESPLVVARPRSDAKRPALLCVAGGAAGNAESGVLRTLSSGIAAGRTVASFELIGAGERRLVLPHDALHVLELELVGLSSFDGATVEALQVLKWLAGRADVDPDHVAIAGTGAGAAVAERISRGDPSHALESPAALGPDLAEEQVRVGDDFLHLRFESVQLARARERREELPPPDRTIPLAERMRGAARRGDADRPLETLDLSFSSGGQDGKGRYRKHVTLVASDRGVRVAVEEWAARHPKDDDETCIAIGPADLSFTEPAGKDDPIAKWFARLAQERGDGAEPPRVFADGAVALPLLSAIVAADVAITSFTASHAIPGFELLLRRPHEAHRAEPSLGVLTQGLPEWVFVPNALTRWEIEDAVLELIGRGVAVDWQDPVDALRRPLSRHDRLAMWPRVRHAKFAR